MTRFKTILSFLSFKTVLAFLVADAFLASCFYFATIHHTWPMIGAMLGAVFGMLALAILLAWSFITVSETIYKIIKQIRSRP